MDDLTARTTQNLKHLALHTLRLARNWGQPLPQLTGPIKPFRCGMRNNILYPLPGTDAIVLYSLDEGTIICADMKTGATSMPMFVGQIMMMSSPLEERRSFAAAALVKAEDESKIVVLSAAIDPAVATSVVFTRELDKAYTHSDIFMTPSVVGVSRVLRGGNIEVQSFNLLNPELSTIIVTDRPSSRVLGSTVIGDTVYFIILQGKDAFVYACPPRLLANAEPSPEIDYSIHRSHVARIPRPPDAEDLRLTPTLTRIDYCVLSTEPNHGRNTISIVRNVTTSPSGRQTGHSLEITFWPRPPPSGSEEAGERAAGRRMLPTQTIRIPGSLRTLPGSTWELLVIANSGLAIVLVVDPPPDRDVRHVEETGEALQMIPRPVPKLLMARYDPELHSVSLHELRIPAGTGTKAADHDADIFPLRTRHICSLALDDHRGYVIVVTVHGVLHQIPYA